MQGAPPISAGVYCSAECQRLDWPRHKKQCRDLAALRVEFEEEHGFAPDSGQHPALTYKHNLATGISIHQLGPAASDQDLQAKLRQNVASLLVGFNVKSEGYVHTANLLASAMVRTTPWEVYAAEINRMVVMGMGLSRIDARRMLGYREGECSVLMSELRHKLGAAAEAKVAFNAVVKGTLLVVPPDTTQAITDAWLAELGARCPHLEEVHMPFCRSRATPAGLAALLRSLPRLRVLNVVGSQGAVDDAVLDALGGCPALRELSFGHDNDRLPPELVTAGSGFWVWGSGFRVQGLGSVDAFPFPQYPCPDWLSARYKRCAGYCPVALLFCSEKKAGVFRLDYMCFQDPDFP